MNKVGIPKGMRDFSPETMAKRNYIFNTIRQTFEKFGYAQIETPTMENIDTLTGKYGEEGDRLIFRVLQRGEKIVREVNNLDYHLNKSYKSDEPQYFPQEIADQIVSRFVDGGLRYDLTVPFARYVVQHQNEITFPFKRYQIQPVWRADRPQKGRYREFYQCDADVIGSDSQINELELVQIFDEVLSHLQLQDFSIKINNRKVLSGIAELIGRPDKLIDITVAIDKLDKIGKEKVFAELESKGLGQAEIQLIEPLFELKGDNIQVLSQLKLLFKGVEIGLEGVSELEELLHLIGLVVIQKAKIEIDVTLARGLNYYTGAIFEVQSNEVQIGSICGGGRYADLTGIFGLKNMSGVGISFGADRIYDVLEHLNRFPEAVAQSTQLLIVNFGGQEQDFALQLLQRFRQRGIRAELYPDAVKMPKQLKYANQRGIEYVLMAGSQEITSGELTLKNMLTGNQEKASEAQIIEKLTS